MKPFEDFVVPWVKTGEPYSARHMDIAWENPDVIRLMSNENLVPPNERILKAVQQASQQGNLYPGSGKELREKLGNQVGLQADNIVLGNGSTDIIDSVIRTFISPSDEAVLPEPSFSMYKARLLMQGGTAIGIQSDDDYNFSINRMIQAITSRTKLIFLCSPNNPTGNILIKRDLIRILEQGIPTFFDEAYYEFQDEVITRADLINSYPHLMINRTFSKAMGLAGFRLGYLICDTRIAEYINRVKIPWNVSHLTIAAALALLEDPADIAQKRSIVIEGRKYIQEELNQLPDIWAYSSQGNFVLIDAGVLHLSSNEIRDRMMKKGVFVRPMSGIEIGKGFFRVTVGLPEQNRKFIDAFRELFDEVMGS